MFKHGDDFSILKTLLILILGYKCENMIKYALHRSYGYNNKHTMLKK